MTGENGELRHVKLNAATESRWSLCVWRGGAASRGVTLGCEAAVREDLAHASLLAQAAQRGRGLARPPLSCGLRASLPPPSLGRQQDGTQRRRWEGSPRRKHEKTLSFVDSKNTYCTPTVRRPHSACSDRVTVCCEPD